MELVNTAAVIPAEPISAPVPARVPRTPAKKTKVEDKDLKIKIKELEAKNEMLDEQVKRGLNNMKSLAAQLQEKDQTIARLSISAEIVRRLMGDAMEVSRLGGR